MKTDKVYYNRNLKVSNLNINFTVVGIFLFTLCFSTINSFVSSYEIEIFILFASILTLLFSVVFIKKRLILSYVDIAWLIFLSILIINIGINNAIDIFTIYDVAVYFLAIIFLILVKVNIDYFESSFKLIKLLGVIYASSAIFQYLFTDLYLSYILPRFSTGGQHNVLLLMSENSYAGFTSQTAYLAGFIVNGIGVLIFANFEKKYSTLIFPFALFILMLIGLLLTSKRAHLIFMLLSVVITYIFSISNKQLLNKIIKLILSFIGIMVALILLFNIISINVNSPIFNTINELKDTVEGVVAGEDVTSGRSKLYNYSLELFRDNPILGIGWREFINNSIGIINSDRGSHPHNIYLQLLTEMGIVGFVTFMIPVLIIYLRTFRMLRKICIENDKSSTKWKNALQFSFYSQTFFLLYGLTGNLLTDHSFILVYFFACSIGLSTIVSLKSKEYFSNINN